MHNSRQALATTHSIHAFYARFYNFTLLYKSQAIRSYKGEVEIFQQNLRPL